MMGSAYDLEMGIRELGSTSPHSVLTQLLIHLHWDKSYADSPS
jgi:hypothetical protein